MAFEIVTEPHLPPNRCAACGGTQSGEQHVFLPNNAAWEYGWVFLCRTCVAEMAGALGLQPEPRVVETITVREPTEAEILTVIERRFALVSSTVSDTGQRPLAKVPLAGGDRRAR